MATRTTKLFKLPMEALFYLIHNKSCSGIAAWNETITYAIEVANTADGPLQNQGFPQFGIRTLVTVSSSAPETVTVSGSNKTLSNGAVAGIVLGAVAMVMGIITALTFLRRRSQNK
ncbi:hypothetical protein BT96DRAFT_186755 [Gymnopus androsaceus JB14]|uniref:Uncharacterized protein n=1 Tax=Gymnopus androsaceus JB14 TaxID=1447944 RepID=A0A6A4H9R3_9AGAR|nr:hypothetical protein BT96DRAFT_186755 [Gymnopus androsaceus JB14]